VSVPAAAAAVVPGIAGDEASKGPNAVP
jgi:hypothetical protein